MNTNEGFETEGQETPVMETFLKAVMTNEDVAHQSEACAGAVKNWLKGSKEPEPAQEKELEDLKAWIKKELAEQDNG